ncbi:MAG: hypothetical protein K6E47_13085 [Lachnospiraceae bacterium]|nr:hypothetical protein [Lachnospiraceae bacterium]
MRTKNNIIAMIMSIIIASVFLAVPENEEKKYEYHHSCISSRETYVNQEILSRAQLGTLYHSLVKKRLRSLMDNLEVASFKSSYYRGCSIPSASVYISFLYKYIYDGYKDYEEKLKSKALSWQFLVDHLWNTDEITNLIKIAASSLEHSRKVVLGKIKRRLAALSGLAFAHISLNYTYKARSFTSDSIVSRGNNSIKTIQRLS